MSVSVTGTWNIFSIGEGGEKANQTVQLIQHGSQLTGHFKGPHQSGEVTGVVNGNHVFFETKTQDILHFRGEVEGNHMQGTVGNRGKTGTFSGNRSSGF